MENRKISIKTIIILIMVVIIIALVMMNLNNKNNNIEQQLTQKEQLEEITEDSAYVLMETHTSEVQEKEQKLVSFKSAIANSITEMGITTAENADAETMANNIKSISGSSGDCYLLCDIRDFRGGTFEVPENVYPYKFIYSSSTYYGSTSEEVTEEEYDSSSSSNKITIGNPTYIQSNLYKVDDTHFTLTGTAWYYVVLGKSRS